MNNYEKEKIYWEDLLTRGEIDRETYNRQIEKIDLRYDFNSCHNIKDKSNKISKKKKIIILIGIICVITFIYFKFFYIDESRYIVSDIGNLEDPIQEIATK